MSTEPLRRRACPVCGEPNTDTPAGPLNRAPWVIITCAGCGFVHMRDVPKVEALAGEFSWDKTFPIEAARRRRDSPLLAWLDARTRWRLHLFPRVEPVAIIARLAPPGPVLDIGCGGGAGMLALPAHHAPCGIEISPALAAEAAARLAPRGGRVIQASALDGLAAWPDGSLSGAVLRSFLEHDADAAAVIQRLRGALREDGVAVVKVPNYGSLNRRVMGRKWCGIRLPDHVNYFTRHSLTRMVTDAGFEIHFPLLSSLPTDDNMIAVLRPQPAFTRREAPAAPEAAAVPGPTQVTEPGALRV